MSRAETIRNNKNWNLVLIRRTDRASSHVILFAHGVGTDERFPLTALPDGRERRIHFYIEDSQLFQFTEKTFEFASRGQLRPLKTHKTGGSVENYKLTKAAGRHIKNVEARKSYGDLQAIVEDSASDRPDERRYEGVVLRAAEGFDIVSIRNRMVGATQTLRSVLEQEALQRYTDIHCFFCRAPKSGKDGGVRAPNKVNDD